MRKNYEMTQKQFEKLMAACKAVPVILVGGVSPSSPQENANRAWACLGEELNFNPMTVKPIAGKEAWHFSAEELPPPPPPLPKPREALAALVFQLENSGWVDKMGHPIELNVQFQTALKVVGK